ncbi:ABC transporter permease [[Actinomadura] parvosata]|uniref:ABC transporter permease n=1 Tax=[Actinomadura] parvosata TaxID=1955412 RepID=UPI00406C3F9D
MLLTFARAEALRTLRNRRYLIFVVAFPVLLYLINANIYGRQSDGAGVGYNVVLMVSMAAYGALAASMMSSAVPLATERQTGWLRQIQITPLPSWAVVAAKLGSSMALVLPSLLLVGLVAIVQQGVSLPPERWAELLVALWLGAVPFVALGLALGSALSAEAAQPAAMICMFALTIAGGLWFPPELFGSGMKAVAELTPSYHYASIGWSLAGGHGLATSDVLVVLAWAVVLGGAAAVLYRRATVRI